MLREPSSLNFPFIFANSSLRLLALSLWAPEAFAEAGLCHPVCTGRGQGEVTSLG